MNLGHESDHNNGKKIRLNNFDRFSCYMAGVVSMCMLLFSKHDKNDISKACQKSKY